MTHVLRNAGERHVLCAALLSLLVLLSLGGRSSAADIAVEETRSERNSGGVVVTPDGEERGRVVVVPEPNWGGWSGWDDVHPWHHHDAPRVQLWIDRGP